MKLISTLFISSFALIIYSQNASAIKLKHSYELSSAFDNNITRSEVTSDKFADVVNSVSYKIALTETASDNKLVKYFIKGEYENYSNNSLLNNVKLLTSARFSLVGGRSFLAPLYSLDFTYGSHIFNTDNRDSSIFILGFNVNRWFTDLINSTYGIKFENVESKSKVFDTQNIKTFINFDYLHSQLLTQYLTFSAISGNLVSIGSPTVKIIDGANSIEADTAYGGINANALAYNINATSFVIVTGINYGIAKGVAIDTSLVYVDTSAANDNKYQRIQLRASLLGRF